MEDVKVSMIIMEPTKFEKFAMVVGKVVLARQAYVIIKNAVETYKEQNKKDAKSTDHDCGFDFDTSDDDVPSNGNENVTSAD